LSIVVFDLDFLSTCIFVWFDSVSFLDR